MLPFADPLGSFGLPGFRFFSVAFGMALVLLKNDGLDSGLRRDYGRDVQHCDVPLWVFRIVGIMAPGIYPIRLRMSDQIKYFDNTFP
jgi:hypothetical protein